MMRRNLPKGVVAAALYWLVPSLAAAAAVNLELNKLEQRGEDCRLYLVVDNATAQHFSAFKLDLVLFGQDGVIARRLAVDAAPLKARKTSLKLFDLPQIDCAAIARVLVNEVLACRAGAQELSECESVLTVSSRSEVELRL